jgi:hypothetical protein
MSNEERRHPNDGKPYYCNHCGSSYGACEDGPCELEPASAAEARRQRWLDGIAGHKAKSIKPQASPRATVLPLLVNIAAIPHKDQRYDTCGDWYYGYLPLDETLVINVSSELSRHEMLLVAIHELIEAFLCECAGITEQQVDAFDHGFEQMRVSADGEPGDQITAPYYHQHQIATEIERILAAEVGVDWLEYERHIQELSNGQ